MARKKPRGYGVAKKYAAQKKVETTAEMKANFYEIAASSRSPRAKRRKLVLPFQVGKRK